MLKKILPVLFFTLFIASLACGQSKPTVQQQSLLKLSVLFPGIEYETKLERKVTIKLEAGPVFVFGYGGNRVDWVFEYVFFVEAAPRFYYNFDNRLADGKEIANYSGNYISFVSRALLFNVFSSYNFEPNSYIFGPTWGLQRMWGKHWYFNFEIGPGIEINQQGTSFVPVAGIDIGLLL